MNGYTESPLVDEVREAKPEDLGEIDTFRFEEEKMLAGALDALHRRDWATAAGRARRRIDGESFWLRRDAERSSVWQLIDAAATLGQRIVEAGPSLGTLESHDAAIDRYVQHGAAVDGAHRQLEQRRRALLYPRLPEFDRLRGRLDDMRVVWREWADGWARDYNQLCKTHGFLPAEALQQRHFFDDVVAPLTKESGTTALFVIDAFRFEMGQEFFAGLSATPATTVHLGGRLAELPTITAVGMNVLAPVAKNGRLRPAKKNGTFSGFSTGEFRVSDPPSRKRAMHDRVGGSTCPLLTLKEAVSRHAASLKRSIAQARLVVVHRTEIDDAGEKDFGPAVFDQVLQKIRAAWRLLREAGVRRFVFTADHGFLLRDGLVDTQSHGRKIDPHRRHVISAVAADHAGEVRVPLADLGYEESADQLMFPETTAVFDTGRRSMSFVHGGNTLQERLIPVLTVNHRSAVGGDTMQYAVKAQALDPVGGMHCLTATVEIETQQALDFGGSREIELAMRVPEAPSVAAELCQVRGWAAQLVAGSIRANVGESFELFFRLEGEVDGRVQVELYHPGAEAEVIPCALESRFDVMVRRGVAMPKSTGPQQAERREWLAALPEGGVRQLFEHLAQHGAVTEPEAASMLGGPRQQRRFAIDFEQYAARAPFNVRIDVVGGVKRYVREGTTP